MKIKDIFIWLFIFVVGSLIVTFLISPNSFDRFKDNVADITGRVITEQTITEATTLNEPEDIQITECLAKFNECKRISETKTGASIKINEYKKFKEYEEALSFYETWSSSQMKPLLMTSMMQNIYLPKDNFPVILIATSGEWDSEYGRIQMPYVAVCDSNYNLVGQTKTIFNC